MTTKVRIRMFPCGNVSEIRVSGTIDGRYMVMTDSSTCEKARRFVEGLGPLTLDDLADKKRSRIFRDFIDSDMSANCLLLPGVMTAAWAEAGMIAVSAKRRGESLSIEFID